MSRWSGWVEDCLDHEPDVVTILVSGGDSVYLSADGVHRTQAGHTLLADAWLSCVSADG